MSCNIGMKRGGEGRGVGGSRRGGGLSGRRRERGGGGECEKEERREMRMGKQLQGFILADCITKSR